MKLLLDTHTLLWALSEPEKLSDPARLALENVANEVWVSAVSLFEIATKVRLGKLNPPAFLLKQWGWTLAKLGAKSLDLNCAHALRAGSLEMAHKDPFDRLLAAQALEENLLIVSCDKAFLQCDGLCPLW